MPMAMTPLKTCCITATNELQINSLIKLYPNPGNTDFIISGFHASDETITKLNRYPGCPWQEITLQFRSKHQMER